MSKEFIPSQLFKNNDNGHWFEFEGYELRVGTSFTPNEMALACTSGFYQSGAIRLTFKNGEVVEVELNGQKMPLNSSRGTSN